jgi:hypothetical protein
MGGLEKQRHRQANDEQKMHAMGDLLGIWTTNLITRDNLRKASTLNDEKLPFAHLQRRCPPTGRLVVFEFSDDLDKHERNSHFPTDP